MGFALDEIKTYPRSHPAQEASDMLPLARRAICTLTVCVLVVTGLTTASWATAAETHHVRGFTLGPPECQLSVFSPSWHDDRLLGRGSVYCCGARAAYLRTRGQIQRPEGDAWSIEAGALGSTAAPADYFNVRVSTPNCTPGRYRTQAVMRYRWSVEDRWTLFGPPFYGRATIGCE